MNEIGPLTLAQVAFGTAAVAHAALLIVAPRNRASRPGNFFLLAISLELIWSVTNFLVSFGYSLAHSGLFATEILRALGWALFLSSLYATLPTKSGMAHLLSRMGNRSANLPIALSLLIIAGLSLGITYSGLPNSYLIAASLLAAVSIVVFLEQIWRNADPKRRWGLKFLAIGLVLKFGLDIVVFSDSLLFNRLQIEAWIVRGLANVLIVPLLAIATVRNTDWRLAIGVSRNAVFFTTTLMVCGGFLLVVALGGYYLRIFGGDWGSVATGVIMFTSIAGLLILIASGTARAKLRVFIAKNFSLIGMTIEQSGCG